MSSYEGDGCPACPHRQKTFLRAKLSVMAVFLILLAANVELGAKAGQYKEQMAEGIAVFLALSLFAKSAVESANAEREKDNYSYKKDLGTQENALAACIHRAYRNVTQAGGHSLRLENVEKILEKSGGEFEVIIQVTEFHSTGESRETTVKCVVKGNKVTDVTS